MPQRKQITWTELRVGLFVLVGLFILAVGIFYVTGAGILSAKYTLKTYLPEVGGLTVGSPVKIDGVEVGNVASIRMNPRRPGETIDRSKNIEVVMRVNRDFQTEIRTDSSASLITEGLLGNRYVEIQRGFIGDPLPNNGYVRGTEEAAIKAIVERSADLMSNLNVLSQEARSLIEGLQRGRGSLGKFLTDEALYNSATHAVQGVENLVVSTQEGKGTIGKLFTSDELARKADSAVTRFDAVLAQVQSGQGTLGKLVYDPSIYDEAKQSFQRVNALTGDIQAGKGTLGKLATDESLFVNLRDASASVRDAAAKLNSNQSTAGKIFTDPQLYDNLSGLTGDLRLLIGDFRQNPKKFLHVKFSIF